MLQLAGEEFDLKTARAIVLGYCFGEMEVEWKPPVGADYGTRLPSLRRRRWGYLSYDCQRSDDPPPNIVDVIAPVLLNVTQGYGVRLITDLLAVAPHVREVVSELHPDFRFWDLSPDEVAPNTSPSGDSLRLHQAWYLVESVRGADVAVTHKLLHHAWPHLFPLIDNVTIGKLGRSGAWAQMLEDLNRHDREFADFEEWFEDEAHERGGIALTRLRLYDILLWCRARREDHEAELRGEELLARG